MLEELPEFNRALGDARLKPFNNLLVSLQVADNSPNLLF